MTLSPVDVAGKAPHHEVVSGDVVLAAAGDASGKVKLTGQQWAALYLAGAVFLLILGTLVFDLVMLWRHLPPEPQPPLQLTQANVDLYRALSEHYTVMANAAQERATRLFETFIAACLLPLFAGIVGFIFGRERT